MTTAHKYRKQDLRGLLKTITPFNYLSESVLKEIISGSKIAHYPEGSYIFRQGERSKETLFLILQGQARAVAGRGKGDTVTAVRNRGDFFGVTGLLSDEPYPVSMVAALDLTCLLIKQEAFHKALTSSEKFADHFTKDLASRLKELYRTISSEQDSPQLLEKNTLRQKNRPHSG